MTPERPVAHLRAVQPTPTPQCEPPDGDPRVLRTVFGRFATGITVVTSAGADPHGMTANSFSSVSLDPPLVLVCVAREALMHDTILANEAFAVTVLAAGQEHVARHFASRERPTGLAQFDAVDWAPGQLTGAPLLAGALAWLECALAQVYEAGDHSIFLGRVSGLGHSTGREALLFFGGAYHQVLSDIA
jgi:flavin reductase (DIM6/NTAB) family NADH-FMN oxidoreductase RutF